MLVNPLFRIHSLIACQVPANLLSLPVLIPCLESTVSLYFTVHHAILLVWHLEGTRTVAKHIECP